MALKKQASGLRSFLWNSENKTFLGRTGFSWLKITIFYVIFYACLALFWILCLIIFLQTMNMRYPKWRTNTGSLIGENPGLGFRPQPPEKSVSSTLIWFNHGEIKNWGHWVKELTHITESYRGDNSDRKTTCDYDKPATEDTFCEFRIAQLGGRCTKERKFGYEDGKPCVVIKLNKIYDWKPKLYSNIKDLPPEMPSHVKDTIKRDFSDGNGKIAKQNVWVSCEGETPADVDSLGRINYYPQPGFPSFYFPYTNVKGYQSALVAVEFSNLTIGTLINIECRAWAHNIEHNTELRRGSVHFKLMVD